MDTFHYRLRGLLVSEIVYYSYSEMNSLLVPVRGFELCRLIPVEEIATNAGEFKHSSSSES